VGSVAGRGEREKANRANDAAIFRLFGREKKKDYGTYEERGADMITATNWRGEKR